MMSHYHLYEIAKLEQDERIAAARQARQLLESRGKSAHGLQWIQQVYESLLGHVA